MELLPIAAWHGLDRTSREDQLAQWGDLAADAAARSILNGHPDHALELLEQGRSVLWTQVLNLRTDLTRLAERASGLARRLDQMRVILDTPVRETTLLLPDPAAEELGTGLGGQPT